MRKAVEIKWDINGDIDVLKQLPSEVSIPDDIEDDDIAGNDRRWHVIDTAEEYDEEDEVEEEEPKEINRVSFEIEHANGDTYFGFMISIKTDGTIDIVNALDCSHADTDGDYIFATNNDLYRIQADNPIDKMQMERSHYMNICGGCKYYDACGDDYRTEPCKGREEK